jgi:putative inorganic carbon (hco3(-)) transporter
MGLLNRIIKILVTILFLITPFIFSFYNSELFEIPKIHFIYLITTLIITLHLINWSLGHTKLFNKNPLNWLILLFLISQITCTITSIDIYTSIHGYYSRLNGGLLSIITFSSLFFIIPLYLDDKFKNKLINSFLFSGFLISIYGILEHFGIDKNFWVQDVQSRVFSTLGQPNWLAAYLCILLPFSIYKYLNSSTKKSLTFYFLLSISYYLCLLFTKSKSGILAAIITLAIFFFISFIRNPLSLRDISLKKGNFKNKASLFKGGPATAGVGLILIFILFSLLISNPIKDLVFPTKLDIRNSTLEINNINITPSEDIRKIVWIGSLDLFKKFPILGTGVETFAYSYYWTRPVEHNLTSEWDFLYNKAHNEYLNYLATTGLVGTIPYLLLILSILFYLIKNLIRNSTLEIRNLSLAVLCSFLGILITNAAGFSISIVSLFFFTLPIFIFPYQKPETNLKTKKLLIPIIIFISIYILNQIISSYLADIYFAKSQSSDKQQDYQTAYQLISQTSELQPKNPNYYIQLGLAAAKMAALTTDSQYTDLAIKYTDLAVKKSPANINFWKQRAQTYYYLSGLDSDYFIKTVESMLQAARLAPTDAKIYFNLGQFLESASLPDDAITYYQKAIELKSNYDYAYFALAQIYFNKKDYDLAKKNLELTLQYAPANTDAQEKLKEIKKLRN